MLENEPRAQTESGLKRWLEDNGLGLYADIFLRHRIDLDVIPDLTEQDLTELGLALGDRKRLQRAVAALPRTSAVEQPAASAERSGTSAERRQISAMFCDMVGSTSLSEKFDPEDVRDMIASFRETCVRVVRHYEGFAARYVGDGILVYFGYPTAHEDDAERAVRAALDITQILSTATTDENGARQALAVRIGIATGLAVVGDLIGQGTEERDAAVGETLNLAARLQGLAEPNGVVIAASTQSLLRGKFDYIDLGAQALKGITGKVQAWQVVRPSRAETRFAAATGSRLTPLVNRDEEMTLLLGRWLHAREGKGEVVVLSGEPGIGKSRVVQELRERMDGAPYRRISLQCSPYYTSTAFHPFIEQLKLALELERVSSPAEALANLETAIGTAGGEAEDAAPLLAALLSIPTNGRYKPLALSPQQQKDATVAALTSHLLGQAREQPLLIAIEDAHWIDPTSREVLDLLVEKVQDAAALVIITGRAEFQPSWKAHAHITILMLNRLSPHLRSTLVERIVGHRELPKEVVDDIIVKTDGVPLFVEELTKAVLESDVLKESQGRYVLSGPWRQLAIPATLTDSLMARLDRMGPSKKIAQIGATIGREFSYELLCAVASLPEVQVEAALSHLEDAGLIVRFGFPPDALYSFRHVMIQNAAHDSLLNSERRRLHALIAQMLAEMYPEKAEREPELVAYHLTESGQSEPAARFWLKAGKQSALTGANLEAIGHLRRGLDVVQGNARMPDRGQMELELRIALGTALLAAKGYAVAEAEENYTRALELGRQLEDAQRVFTATRGLWVGHFIRGDLARAHDLSVELMKFARRERGAEQSVYLTEAHRSIAMTMLYRGRFLAAHHHLQRCVGLYKPDLHRGLMERTGIDPAVVSLSYLGYVLWFLGRPDAARQHSEQAIANAAEIGHPFTRAFALVFGAYLCQHSRDVEGTRDYANEAMVIASEHGFLHWKHQATILHGWALAELGAIDEGLSQMRAGLEGYEAMDSWLACCWFRSLLAGAYAKAGLPDAALRALDGAAAIARRTGDHFFLAELYRMQGEILFGEGGRAAADDAENLFLKSLDIAEAQNALAWELRTATSLARLWRASGRRAQAADLLLPTLREFSEGMSTPDMRDAIALAQQLNGPLPEIAGGLLRHE
jgi:class 3 adenylate cyclase/predicted ATPase/ABC-type lipoprotein export system ATPase subunit